MKIYVFVLLIIAAVVIAFPNKDEDIPTLLDLQEQDKSLTLPMTLIKEHHRARRFTCDVLSGLGVDHSACATHCVLRGKTGGRCNKDRVCICRKKNWFG